ncbi:DUF1097 family protein [Pseudomonas aeruginosa]|uniref:DUF1097 domain-containing protein n=1 Tax=Pseudomonas TaxID=286 RepID=UPI001C11EF45|nr:MULTISPECIES: DUF1097 domain-containing protein [Pseudomonas]ELQ8316737.1 DUF1097 family protein [Pseudomonas aeruginosa]MBU5733055.1 DUF1097 family protein [Pseudomonas aeruginosa]MBU5754974.1 DUF1097 family protein [Pseudomonas aeruginosa]UUJ38931.1 DUF1097 family protein [Pseudomonas extremaustralis]HDQ4471761.1 DUF1097 family protein [Pseudomonas aeruginosa]
MSHATPSRQGFVLATLVAATAAAFASATSLALSLPVWAMFIGWIAFFTRGFNTRGAIENLACVGLGLVIGLLASRAIAGLVPITGPAFALPMVVFSVALIVVSLRGLPLLNNLLGYFLGLVAWFAAHLEPSLESVAQLFATTSMGIFLATLARSMPQFGMLMILVLLPLQMLSGGSTPRESMPELVQNIMLIAPTTHFVELSQAILYRGAGLMVVWPTFVTLLIIGSVLFAISLSRFRKTISQMA